MDVKCPFCGGRIEVPASAVAQRVECPTCLALVDPALAKAGSQSEARPRPGEVPAAGTVADHAPEAGEKAGSYSLTAERLATARESIFPSQARPAPRPSPAPGADGGKAARPQEEARPGSADQPFEDLLHDMDSYGQAAPGAGAGRQGPATGAADRTGLDLEFDLDLGMIPGATGAESVPGAAPSGADRAVMPLDLDFADLGPMDAMLTSSGEGPGAGARPVPPPDRLDLPQGDAGSTMGMGSVDFDAAIREDSMMDRVAPHRPASRLPDGEQAILTEGIGDAGDRVGGLDLGLPDSWPETAGGGGYVPPGTEGGFEAGPIGGLELELPPMPEMEAPRGGGGSLQVDIPVTAASPATAAKAGAPATRPAGKAARHAGSGAKVALLGLVLLGLVGAILGQTRYGYFGINLLTGDAPSMRAGGRGPGVAGAPAGSLQRDTRVAFMEEVNRVERQLKDDPKSVPLRAELLDALLRFRERFPTAMASDPKLSARLKDLVTASDLPPRGAVLQALDLMGAGKMREAQAVLAAVTTSSDDPDVPYFLGKTSLALEKPDEALRYFEAALMRNPANVGARFFLAKAFQAKRDLPKAKAALDEVLAKEPEHLTARVALAQVALQGKDLEGATRMAREVLAKGAPGADSMELFQAHLVLSNVADAQARIDERLKELQAALAILPADEETAVTVARLLLSSGKRGEALEALSPCRQRGCASEPFLAAFAQAALADEKEDVAETALKEGEAKYPESPTFALIRGKHQLALNRGLAALSSFQAALKIDPASVEGWQMYGQALSAEGKLSEAVARLKEGLERTKGATGLLMTLAAVYREQRDFKSAEEVLRQATAQEPQNHQAQQELGLAIAAQGRPEEAVKVLAALESRKALEKAGIFGLAGAYLQMKEPARARDLLARLHEAEPADPDIAAEYGRALGEAGDGKKAEEILRKVTTEQPSHALTFYYLGRLLFRGGDLPKATEALQRAVQLDGSNQRFRLEQARVLVAMKTPDATQDAKTLLDTVLAAYLRNDWPLDEREADAYLLRGRILFQEQRYQLAAKDFEAGLGLASGRVDLLAGYGRALFELARYDDARGPLQQVVQKDPGNPEAHYYLGRILLRNEDVKGAREQLQRAIQRDPKAFPDAHRLLGFLYKDAGQTGASRKAFQTYLEYAPKGTAEYDEVKRLVER